MTIRTIMIAAIALHSAMTSSAAMAAPILTADFEAFEASGTGPSVLGTQLTDGGLTFSSTDDFFVFRTGSSLFGTSTELVSNSSSSTLAFTISAASPAEWISMDVRSVEDIRGTGAPSSIVLSGIYDDPPSPSTDLTLTIPEGTSSIIDLSGFDGASGISVAFNDAFVISGFDNINYSLIPEPSTFILAGVGALILLKRRSHLL